MKHLWVGFTIAIMLLLAACQNNDSATTDVASFPKRPVNIIVYSSAGGATDLANRAVADSMKASLGVDVITSNMPGALGGTAVNFVWNQKRDGYRLVGISEGLLSHSVLGLHKTTAKDWDFFMIGGTPGIISVSEKSPYQTFEGLYAAIKSNPGNISIATSVPGSVWNIQWLNTKRIGGFDTKFIPYPGSYPSQTAALTGEVDIVWTGLGEQSEFLKSGKFTPLAAFTDKPVTIAGQTIPPITSFIPKLKSVLPLNQFVGFAIPADTPEALKEKITISFKAAMAGESVKAFSNAKYSSLTGLTGDEAKSLALNQEKVFAWTLWDAGIAKVNPETLGIDKP